MKNNQQHHEKKASKAIQSDDFIENEIVEHSEGPVAKFIEHQTAKLPSDTFLWAAGASIAASLALQYYQKRNLSLFVGQWAPTLLILGLYNKIVKVAGSDRLEQMQTIH